MVKPPATVATSAGRRPPCQALNPTTPRNRSAGTLSSGSSERVPRAIARASPEPMTARTYWRSVLLNECHHVWATRYGSTEQYSQEPGDIEQALIVPSQT